MCWDTNGNGACDPGSEDFTDDGVCDVNDCRGGGNVVNCWDLNGNGTCDPATEDTNGDTVCDTSDCTPDSVGTLSGTVTNQAGGPLSGVAIDLFPAVGGVSLTTDASGAFSGELPIGSYALTVEADGYQPYEKTIGVAAGQTTSLDIALTPVAAVAVSAGDDVTAAPGSTESLTATVAVRDGSTIQSYEWVQVSGPALTLSGDTTETLSATLPSDAEYRAALLAHATVRDRLEVVPINPYGLEEAEVSTFQVTVTTSSGSYMDTVSIHADLPYKVNPGLRNVALGSPLLLHAPDQASWSWTVSGPGGFAGDFDDATSQNPLLVVDVGGEYTVTETVSGSSMTINAAEWVGEITDIGADGLPKAGSCTGCHREGGIAPDKFTPWRASGHAEIFTQNLNTSTHYGKDCFTCHTVGYDPDLANNGFDDQSDYDGFLSSGLLNNPSPDNWSTMVSTYPDTARFGNIQCENCHGPNDFTDSAHAHPGANGVNEARVSISADVCGTCHGEPKRHARFQQWEESGHASLALTENGTVDGRGAFANHCGRCHSGQGYLHWIDQGDLTQRLQGASGNATVAEMTSWGMTAEDVEPQTCTVCHDPHAPGNVSGEPNNATVRVQGDTGMLPSGFAANSVGKGAICMTCHNTRNGLHNDSVPMTSASGPHTPSQTDILMGQNAYFVTTGIRGDHSLLSDTCATCHMEETDPPAELSYNLGGTNHTFEASVSICGNCHGDFDGQGLKDAIGLEIEDLAAYMGESAKADLNAIGSIQVTAYDAATDLYSQSSNVPVDLTANPITHVDVIEGHGQIELHITLTTPISITWSDASMTSTDEFGVQIGSLLDGVGGVIYPPGSNMTKAGWNLLLIEHDGSHGIHNPAFVRNIIASTLNVDLTPP